MRAYVISGLLAVTAGVLGGHAWSQEGAVIVGTGAVPCSRYLADVQGAPMQEREYFAWAQGYMSGLLMRSPAGEHVDLRHKLLPLLSQVAFVRSYCQANPEKDFVEGVQDLYKALRKMSSKDRT